MSEARSEISQRFKKLRALTNQHKDQKILFKSRKLGCIAAALLTSQKTLPLFIFLGRPNFQMTSEFSDSFYSGIPKGDQWFKYKDLRKQLPSIQKPSSGSVSRNHQHQHGSSSEVWLLYYYILSCIKTHQFCRQHQDGRLVSNINYTLKLSIRNIYL